MTAFKYLYPKSVFFQSLSQKVVFLENKGYLLRIEFKLRITREYHDPDYYDPDSNNSQLS